MVGDFLLVSSSGDTAFTGDEKCSYWKTFSLKEPFEESEEPGVFSGLICEELAQKLNF